MLFGSEKVVLSYNIFFQYIYNEEIESKLMFDL